MDLVRSPPRRRSGEGRRVREETWNGGIVEWWNGQSSVIRTYHSTIPPFHYSTIPLSGQSAKIRLESIDDRPRVTLLVARVAQCRLLLGNDHVRALGEHRRHPRLD